ncbi:PaaI family thioesterase [Rhodococcus opacus]|uniref:PaaI family thioesterase n=1 Tax=Rhodococcus opacus TaxID=37919 RepID=UPI00295423E3|nr:PaaI family thioesterase [Rhodococcus opacus]MDV7087596.1 PaaI family thioesterase [Rhodococcus opacus]
MPTADVVTPPLGMDQHDAYRPDWLREVIGIRNVRTETDKITLTIRPERGICNHLGIVHGGLHITLIDHVMCGVLSSTRPDRYELLDLSLVYHRPASLLTEPDLVHAVIDRQGRRITTVTASIASRSGRILTTAHGTFVPDGNA